MEASDFTPATSTTSANNGAGQTSWDAHPVNQPVGRPEIPVIAAFVGGFLLAKLLKRRGGRDDE